MLNTPQAIYCSHQIRIESSPNSKYTRECYILSGKYCNHPTILQERQWKSARGDIVRYFPSARRIFSTCQGNNIHLPREYFSSARGMIPARELFLTCQETLSSVSETASTLTDLGGPEGTRTKKEWWMKKQTRTTTAMKTTTNQTHPPLQWWQSQCCLGDQRQCCWHSQPVSRCGVIIRWGHLDWGGKVSTSSLTHHLDCVLRVRQKAGHSGGGERWADRAVRLWTPRGVGGLVLQQVAQHLWTMCDFVWWRYENVRRGFIPGCSHRRRGTRPRWWLCWSPEKT